MVGVGVGVMVVVMLMEMVGGVVVKGMAVAVVVGGDDTRNWSCGLWPG